MRYLVGLMCVLAGLVALSQSASAQAGEADTTSEPNLQEPAPSSEPASEAPALQLKLDDAGVEVVPTADGFYIIEPTELRVERARGAKIGLGVSAGFLVVGAVMTAVGFTSFDFESSLAPLSARS